MNIRDFRHCILLVLAILLVAPVNLAFAKGVQNVAVTMINFSSTTLYYEKITAKWSDGSGTKIHCTSDTGDGVGTGGSCQATIPVKMTFYGYNGGGYVFYHNQTYTKSVKIFFHSYSKELGTANKCELYVNGSKVRDCDSEASLENGTLKLFQITLQDSDLK